MNAKGGDGDSKQHQSGDLTESYKDSILVAAICSLFSLVIFAISKFNWWLGLAFFAIFVFYILGRLVLAGILFVIEVLVVRIASGSIRARGVNPARFGEIMARATDLLRLNVLIGSLEIYLLSITVLLGVSFFW